MPKNTATLLNNQDYKLLRKALIKKGEKFVDPTFSPSASSIKRGLTNSDVEWHRPSELHPRPHLVVGGIQGSDVMAGQRGNPWFVTATAALVTHPSLFNSVLPNYQGQDYTHQTFHPGIFMFRFYRHGTQYEVTIDDFLPSKKGRLVYCESCDDGEYWSALLEKAYAKFHGDYDCLQYGRAVDALASFTGGIPENWCLSDILKTTDVSNFFIRSKTFKLLENFHKKNSLSLFSLRADSKKRRGDHTDKNLVFGRGYVLKDARQVELKNKETVFLLRLCNSWDDIEWCGAWSDGSSEWDNLAPATFRSLNYNFKNDGDFWMSLEDCFNNFSDIDICHIPSRSAVPWKIICFKNDWGVKATRHHEVANAGGSYEYTQSYSNNPQYLVTVKGPETHPVSFCLQQGEITTACQPNEQFAIGLDLLTVEVNREIRFKEPPPQHWLQSYVPHKRVPSIFLSSRLRPGSYMLVPSTDSPNQSQKFCLHVLSQGSFSVKLLTNNSLPRPGGCCDSCYWKLVSVTQFSIDKIEGLQAYTKKKGTSIYFSVMCDSCEDGPWESGLYQADSKDGEDVHTTDFRILLYRKNFEYPINVKVFAASSSSFDGSFVGSVAFTDRECKTMTVKEGCLHYNGKDIPVTISASLHISGDLDYF